MQGKRSIGVVVLLMFLLCATGALAGESEDGGPDSALSVAPIADPGPEIVTERTVNSETFQLPDGQLVTRIYSSPINYRNSEGDLVPIGEGFEELPSGELSNGANGFDVSLPERLGDGPVRVSDGGEWVASELLSADPEAVQFEGETAVYETEEGGTSFEISSLPDGIKEEIVIADSSQPSTFKYALSASNGLTPELVEDGSIEFRDEAGDPVAVVPAPIMEDSASNPAVSAAVHYALTPAEGGGWDLAVVADRDWLTDPVREWPVRIDPSTVLKSGPTHRRLRLSGLDRLGGRTPLRIRLLQKL